MNKEYLKLILELFSFLDSVDFDEEAINIINTIKAKITEDLVAGNIKP